MDHFNTIKNEFYLPLGLSFFTFTSLAYIIDIYRGQLAAEKNIGVFSVFLTFFPKIQQGPIERAKDLLPQLKVPPGFDYQRITDGMRMMLWGSFKKTVVADRLAVAVNHVYGNQSNYSGAPLILATVFFAFQIYADFSGYTDIARGLALILGYRLAINFNRPYAARSIGDFWSRWHISFSNWLRDYIFLPVSSFISWKLKRRAYFGLDTNHLIYGAAVFMTFFICGLWHGLGMNYITWGLLFALFLVLSRLTIKIRTRIKKSLHITRRSSLQGLLGISATFTLVCFAWIFFRAENLQAAINIIRNIFIGLKTMAITLKNLEFDQLKSLLLGSGLGLSKNELLIAFLAVIFMESIEYLNMRFDLQKKFQVKPIYFRWAVYYTFVLVILYFGVLKDRGFIYSQF
ncbi:MAG: MBOAT family protein [Desulfobacterales bacterium]|nr:MBOAT family protein [Desulfobacterales bacterium]